MKVVLYALLTITVLWAADGEVHPGAKMKNPLEYAIHRFQEVLSGYLKTQDLSIQEKLISHRAALVIAKKRLEDLHRVQELPDTKSQEKATLRNEVIALKMQVDHYETLISRLEKKIKKKSKR